MDKLRKDHKKMLARAKAFTGVEDLMKVYLRFQEANALTAEYMRMVSPSSHQTNSNKSLLK